MTIQLRVKARIGLALIGCLAILALPLFGDTIYFRDGREARGKIIGQNDAAVTIQTTTGRWTYGRADIVRIDYDTGTSSTGSASAPATATATQPVESDAGVGGLGFEVGGSFGLLWFPETESLQVAGGFLGVEVAEGVALRLAYNHSGISLLGYELLSMDLLGVAIMLDVMPASSVGLFVVAGVDLILASALGESITGSLFAVGAGLRLTPADFLTIRAGYVARFKYDVMHGAFVEVAVRL